jgi:TPR repeat protein
MLRTIEITPYSVARVNRNSNGHCNVLCTKNLNERLCFIAINEQKILFMHIGIQSQPQLLVKQLAWMGNHYRIVVGRNTKYHETQTGLPQVFNLNIFLENLQSLLKKTKVAVWDQLKTYHIPTGCMAIQLTDASIKMVTPILETAKITNADARQAINFYNYLSSLNKDDCTNFDMDLQYDQEHWTDMPTMHSLSQQLFFSSIVSDDWEMLIDRLKSKIFIHPRLLVILDRHQFTFMESAHLIHEYQKNVIKADASCENRMMIDLHGASVKKLKEILEKQFAQAREQYVKEIYLITGRGKHVGKNGSRGVLKKVLPKLLKAYQGQIIQVNKEIGAYKIILNSQITPEESIRLFLSKWISPDREEQEEYMSALQRRSKRGNVDALIALSSIYSSTNDNNLAEMKEVITLLIQAKAKGSIKASIYLGTVYLHGTILKQDHQKAFKCFEIAAKAEDATGQFWLAKCYLHGQGIKQDDALAFQWLKKAADQGLAEAQSSFGKLCFDGFFTLDDPQVAIEYLRKAVQQGFSTAAVNLALCYATGYGVSIDYEQAFQQYMKAAEKNHIYALHQVGRYYLEGRGVKKDIDKSFQFFLKAAELGDGDSQGQVGLAFLYGDGVAPDLEKAREWLVKSSVQGNKEAEKILQELDKEVNAKIKSTVVEKEQETEQAFLFKAAELGDSNAQFNLGLYLLAKQGDVAQAMYWLEKSYVQGNKLAEKFLHDFNEEFPFSSDGKPVETGYLPPQVEITSYPEYASSKEAKLVTHEAEAGLSSTYSPTLFKPLDPKEKDKNEKEEKRNEKETISEDDDESMRDWICVLQ